jgi:hypothetical protein
MDWIESRSKTKLHTNKSRRGLSIQRKLSWPRPIKSHNNTENDNYTKRNRYNVNLHTIAKRLCLILASTVVSTPAYAADVGGVSATANPIANSSGSVTNQAIQVLQGPYITNTYGNGIQCQGATMNVTPYITGTGNFKRPFEHTFLDPVYNVHDADDDGQIDNPGDILYYVPTRTGQQDSYNLSVGLSATWSRPLDKEAREKCMEAVTTQINLQNQVYANKRLDFELARLKNCGELMKAGIIFHPKSQYAAVCADVKLINPPGTLPDHTHSIKANPPITNDASSLKTISIGNTKP